MRPVWGIAAATLLAIVLLRPYAQHQPGMQQIALTSTRSAESAPAYTAGTPLDLSLETAGLPAAAAYIVEIVDGEGAVRWQSPPAASVARVNIPQRLSAGQHWVRIYAHPKGADPLREFSLRLK